MPTMAAIDFPTERRRCLATSSTARRFSNRRRIRLSGWELLIAVFAVIAESTSESLKTLD
jgi:hypothetical protein